MRWAWAEIDHDAIAHNIRVLREAVAPSSVWVAVKADGYGHGAVAAAAAALSAGAHGLCVAIVDEGVELRAAGITAPILVLSEQPPEDLGSMIDHDLTPTVYSAAAVEALERAGESRRRGAPYGVHLKIDTGMHRVGAHPDDVVTIAAAIAASDRLDLAGVFTHLAMSDEPDAPSNSAQLAEFDRSVAVLRAAGHDGFMVHAANTAAALAFPHSRFDAVRVGIGAYGIAPGPAVRDLCRDLRPALALRSRVSLIKQVAAGEGVSYGLRHVFRTDATVATVPIGYGDGVPRRLFGTGGEVLVHGVRLPIVGVVTMDQLMIDVTGHDVAVGDDVVLIGAQRGAAGSDEITAEEWATRLGTIGYEIVCGISKRIARRRREPLQ